jgi:hypothetical protein
MAELPSYDLQMKAAEERRRLHNTVAELRTRVHEELEVKKLVRSRLGAICALTSVVALAGGYLITGMFVRH